MLVIPLPENFVAELSAQATQIVADLFPVWALIGGIFLGLAVLAFVVSMFQSALGRAEVTRIAGLERMEEEDAEFFGLDESTVVDESQLP